MFKVDASGHPPSPACASSGEMTVGQLSTRELLALLLRCFGYVEIRGFTRALANPGARKLILDGLCVLARTI